VRATLPPVLLVSLALGWLSEPQPLSAAKPSPVPPFRRLLRGEDARRARELKAQLAEQWEAGHFDVALRAAEALAALRERVQGADHWWAVSARWDTEAIRRILKQDAATQQAVARIPARMRQADAQEAKGQHRTAQPLCEEILRVTRQALGEEHPDTARGYYKLASNLQGQGKYAQAEPLLQKALAVCRKLLGEEHPYTALTYNSLALDLNAQGHLAEAEPLLRKAVAVSRKALGPEHLQTGAVYNNLATNLNAQGRYAEAEPLLQKALAISRKVLGPEHPQTAAAYNNLAMNLHDQGKYAEAEPFCRQALAVFQLVLGQADPQAATCYNNLARNLDAQGRYMEAQPFLQKALAVRRQVLGEAHPDTASSYNNLALNSEGQGNYTEAEPLLQKALTIARQVLGEEHRYTATCYNNLAGSLDAQARYAEAEPFHRKALAVRRQVLGEVHPDTASSYNNLAANLDHQGKHAAAEPLYQEALALCRKALGEGHPDTATSYHNLAVHLGHQGRYAEAEALCRKVLVVRRTALGEGQPDTASSYNILASTLNSQGRYAEAEPLLRKALAIAREALGEEHPHTARSCNNLAATLNAQGQYATAEQLWTRGAEALTHARLRVAPSGLGRASFTGELSSLPALAAVLARNGKPREAWRRYEDSLARGTWDDVSARRRRSPAEQDRQTALAQELDRIDKLLARVLTGKATVELEKQRQDLLDRRRELQDQLHKFARELEKKYGPVAGQVFDLATIQKALPADAALLGWVDVSGQPKAADPSGEHWALLLRSQGQPAWEKLAGSGKDGAWTEADERLPAELRRALLTPQGAWRPLAERLRKQRLGPLARHLAVTGGLPAVRQFVVLPSPALAGVPAEVFAEGYAVSYAPSGTLFAHLRQLPPPDGRGLLAVADPAFAGPKGKAAPPPLPGTRAEAEALRRLCRGAGVPFRLLVGSRASEQELFALAGSGELAKLRYLHLATHGAMNDHLPLQSAVLLARDGLPEPLQQLQAGRPVYDGRLTADKVLRHWHLNADLVTLSACETALGKYERGEGHVGFAQALLLAGSRSVCLSLWKVDDTATALLMQRFYEDLLGRRPGLKGPLAKADALAEAQRWLRELPAKEAEALARRLPEAERIGTAKGVVRPRPAGPRPYEHPYYWAAFILLGDPG
jgi:CHAT domain-containing protein/tetratricopeptide (TPR) repeat protein